MRAKTKWCFDLRSNLRAKNFVIGYWHLIAGLFSTVFHLMVAYILTDGFRCETSKESLRAVQWSWLEPFLLCTNMGAHGFYPYPLIFNYHPNPNIQYLSLPEDKPPCHTVMSVIYVNDIMYFLFNVLWMCFVLSYIIGIHKRDPGPLITFFIATCIKLVFQVKGVFEQSSFGNAFLDILYKIVDICLIVIFLQIILKHIKELRKDKNRKQPPGFFENLYIVMKAKEEKRKEPVFTISYNEKPPIIEEKEGKVLI
ncbi:uncharacterized protein LOC112047970 [Bicyclus anynana]|uniref:Uncharacterized protein LOC112047970 n=1 Tax=Bicyclus anynana TaxID=110368 RepID=A0ABM3LZ80_BICAN|nr:uncharacterized protein LOC112047970 [Bicyclus anynana]XP_052744386.1 uncharacterized protein LOC112047970 [Bicyclus anynana]XP_052744387.1 uncharacterized protein LOC112047970 [Bicyclus anynana]